jgi:ankyrin
MSLKRKSDSEENDFSRKQKPSVFIQHDNFENIEMLKHLYSDGLDINQMNRKGKTVLHLAAENGKSDVVGFLLENGADVNLEVETEPHLTPIYLATRSGSLECVKLLVNHRATLINHEFSYFDPLFIAIKGGFTDIVKYLLEVTGIDINTFYGYATYKITPLAYACNVGNVELINLFIELGADVDCGKRITPACSYMVTPMHQAIDNGRVDIVKLLFEHGASIIINFDQKENWRNTICCEDGTYLNRAVRKGDIGLVEFLLENGSACEINKHSDLYRDTPLIRAISQHSTTLVTLLLEHGASISYGPHCDLLLSPIEVAKRKGNTAIIELLRIASNKNAPKSKTRALPVGRSETAYYFTLENSIDQNKKMEIQVPNNTPLRFAFYALVECLEGDQNIPEDEIKYAVDEASIGVELFNSLPKEFVINQEDPRKFFYEISK